MAIKGSKFRNLRPACSGLCVVYSGTESYCDSGVPGEWWGLVEGLTSPRPYSSPWPKLYRWMCRARDGGSSSQGQNGHSLLLPMIWQTGCIMRHSTVIQVHAISAIFSCPLLNISAHFELPLSLGTLVPLCFPGRFYLFTSASPISRYLMKFPKLWTCELECTVYSFRYWM